MLKSKMRSENPRELMAEINVTPLVDVCLVLVIIFMVTTAMFLQPPFEVQVPKVQSADQSNDGNIFVAIAPDGQLAVNESLVTAAQFPEQITLRLLQSRSKKVIIRADGKVKSRIVLQTLDLVKQAGAQRISFGTEGRP